MVELKNFRWRAKMSMAASTLLALPLMGMLEPYVNSFIPTSSQVYWWLDRLIWVKIATYVLSYVAVGLIIYTILTAFYYAIKFAQLQNRLAKKLHESGAV